jgi:hypothetical protein
LIDILLSDVGIEIGTLDKAKEELVDDLQVGPSKFENRLVLLWIKCVTSRVDLRRDRSEQVGRKLVHQLTFSSFQEGTYHIDDLWVNLLRDHTSILRNVFQHFMQSLRLDLLSLKLGTGVVEIKYDFTLL